MARDAGWPSHFRSTLGTLAGEKLRAQTDREILLLLQPRLRALIEDLVRVQSRCGHLKAWNDAYTELIDCEEAILELLEALKEGTGRSC